MKFKKAYETRTPQRLSFEGVETLTEQHHKSACDINKILQTYDKTGLITHVAASKAEYGDFTTTNEYQEALNLVIQSQNAFAELPSHIRKEFDNDPGAFLEFATDPSNHEKMVELGLAYPKPEPEVQKVEIINQNNDVAGA